MQHYKYESKWRKGFYYPLTSLDSLSELKKFKYNIINITEDDYNRLQISLEMGKENTKLS